MDEANAQIRSQGSVCSEGVDDALRSSGRCYDSRRLCLLGKLSENTELRNVAESFDLPVVSSKNGLELLDDDNICTVFVLEEFEGEVFNALYKAKQLLLGPPALQQLAARKQPLPHNTRPLYNLAMSGAVICFTGFRSKDELTKLVPLIHHMGGSIRKDVSMKITHLIANTCGGEKYLYASTFRVPIMNLSWVLDSWEHRNQLDFTALLDSFTRQHKLKPFHGARVCFVGFPEEEEKHMTEVLLLNGGVKTSLDDPTCSHVVMEQEEVYTLDSNALKAEITSPPSHPRTPLPDSSTFKPNPLETLHENSDLVNGFGNISFDSLETRNRKRKNSSCAEGSQSKRKREKCLSEKKKRVSNFFKTPIGYFSNRRRTIGSSSFCEGMNDSVLSSSGVFSVETAQNLSCFEDSSTPRSSKRLKKNLFTRTFSSSKFLRSKSKRLESKMDCCELDGDKLNASCFPDISLNPLAPGEGRSRTGMPKSSVVDESSIGERPEGPAKSWVVKAAWFWTSVQKEICLEENEYLFDNYIEQVLSPSARRDSQLATPSSASRRKRKRLHETLSALVHQQSPSHHKRRSSISEAGLLSVSNSFLDCTTSPDKPEAEPVIDTPRKGLTPRHQVFLELLQTESNYVDILHTIIVMFKKTLEEMPENEALLNNTELNLIFGKLPPIFETHLKMLEEFKKASAHWAEDKSIGNIIVKYSTELLKAYPPFINYFEEMKEVLTTCDQNKPRFHAFLKACQTRPECGRQSLQELMIRPVQRLGSISLLLNDILKNTPKTNADHAALEQALAALREVMTHINEDKRKAEGQVTLFNIFNDIDNCPPDIVSSHRSFIAKTEVIQLSSSEGLSSKGNNLVLFLFSDQLEVCKKKSKAFNNLKSPSNVGTLQSRATLTKPYKHVKLLALNAIKKVIDIKETEDCQKVFSLVCRNNDDTKEKLYSFAMADEEADKVGFLKTLTRQMANNACTADADKFLAYLEPQQLDIDTSDLANNGTLSKAFKFATRTKIKVGRAFSFNKTPSKLKRAVSSMMSPFGSSTNLTPATQLAQMRLASYNNINELGNSDKSQDTAPMAPLSVQPTRKMKASSLGVNTLKRI